MQSSDIFLADTYIFYQIISFWFMLLVDQQQIVL